MSLKKTEDGLVIYTEYARESGLLVDPTFIDDKTLGLRRLRYEFLEDKPLRLYKLNRPIHSISELIKSKSYTKTYIDSAGKVFKYLKPTGTSAKLISLPIKKVVESPLTSTKGILFQDNSPIVETTANYHGETFARILVIRHSRLFYGFEFDYQEEERIRV